MVNNIENCTPVIAISSKGIGEYVYDRYISIATELAGRGLHCVALNGAVDRTGDSAHFSRFFEFGSDGLREVTGTYPLRVDAARDLTGGMARFTPVAALNPELVRNISRSKLSQYTILSEADIAGMPQTFFVEPTAENISDALALFGGQDVVIKPEKGRASKGVVTGKPKDLTRQVAEYVKTRDPKSGLVAIQEFMPEIKNNFSSLLRPLTDQDAELMRARGLKEIRVHVIDGEPFLVHGKVSADEFSRTQAGDNKYVHFDPDSVPDNYLKIASMVARAIADRAAALDSYLAVDLTPDGTRVIEVNGCNPGSIGLDPTRGDNSPHTTWRDGLVEKLAGMAHREYAKRGEL